MLPSLERGECVTNAAAATAPHASADLARAAEPSLALEKDQIERRRIAGDRRKQAMRLPAVMGLVVEKMVERGRKLLLDMGRVRDGAIADASGQVGFAQS